MQPTRHSDDAVRVVQFLALDGHRRRTVPVIAAVCGISESHLVRVAHRLG